jgi:hypothetical protein
VPHCCREFRIESCESGRLLQRHLGIRRAAIASITAAYSLNVLACKAWSGRVVNLEKRQFIKLLEKGRIKIACNPEEWIRIALDMLKLRLVPLAPVIAYKSTILPGKVHDDPADQIIVSTACEENIIFKNERIRKYFSVNSIW